MAKSVFLPALYVTAGIALFAAIHHAMIGYQRPAERVQLLFSALCAAVGIYVLLRTATYQAQSVEGLIRLHRLDLSAAMLALAIMPWFIASYTGARPRWPPVILSGLFIILSLVGLLVLRHGLHFSGMPVLHIQTLPWGEKIVDLSAGSRSAWYVAAWFGCGAMFAYAGYACVQQYRKGARREAVSLGIAMAIFGVLALDGVAFGGIFYLSQFAFVAVVIAMSRVLGRERRETRQRMQIVLDHVPGIVSLKDRNGRYLYVNRWFQEENLLDLPKVLRHTDHELFPRERADVSQANDERVIETGWSLDTQETFDTAAGKRTWYSVRFPVADSDGRVWALGNIATDVTELRAAEQEARVLRHQLWHMERVARTEMISASIAHELLQPLAAILSNAQAGLRFLDRDSVDLTQIRELLVNIASDDKRASKIISGLRTMLSSKETPPERVDVAECILEVVEIMRTEFTAAGIECTHGLREGCSVVVNKTQLQQVVLNLLMNAVQAVDGRPPNRRRIRVGVAAGEDREVWISVQDNGPGISESDFHAVFDAFFTTKAEGMGIGLVVCRSIVETHAGRIWAERNDSQEGMTFFVALPAAADDSSTHLEGVRTSKEGSEDGSKHEGRAYRFHR